MPPLILTSNVKPLRESHQYHARPHRMAQELWDHRVAGGTLVSPVMWSSCNSSCFESRTSDARLHITGFVTFIDDGETAGAVFVAGIARADIVEVSAVDFFDDFQMARKQSTEERDRPLFKSLGHQRVVSVGEGLPPPAGGCACGLRCPGGRGRARVSRLTTPAPIAQAPPDACTSGLVAGQVLRGLCRRD